MALLITDPVFLRLTATGDVNMANFGLIAGLAAFAAGAEARIELVMGEWFADLELGVDWYGSIFGKEFDEVEARTQIRAAIMDTPGAVEVTQIALALDDVTRVLAITWECTVEFTDTAAAGEISLPIAV